MVSERSFTSNFSISRSVAGLSRLRKISPKSKIIVLIIPVDLQIINPEVNFFCKISGGCRSGNSLFEPDFSGKNPCLIPNAGVNKGLQGSCTSFNYNTLDILLIKNPADLGNYIFPKIYGYQFQVFLLFQILIRFSVKPI